MNKLTIIALRLIALWFFIEALGYLQFLPGLFTGQVENTPALGFLLVFVIYIAASGLLFFRAPALASLISSDLDGPAVQIDRYEQLAAVLFATAGLLVFFNGLESFMIRIGQVFFERSSHPSHQLLKNISVLLFGGGIQMIIGAGLFIGGKNIARWWYNLKNWS